MQFFIDFLFFAFFEMNSNQHIIERDDQESIFFKNKNENPELNFNDSEEFFSLENKNQLIREILSFTQNPLHVQFLIFKNLFLNLLSQIDFSLTINE